MRGRSIALLSSGRTLHKVVGVCQSKLPKAAARETDCGPLGKVRGYPTYPAGRTMAIYRPEQPLFK